ncbi:unnamed protein product [Gordionus sp. m RMFG-2023]
MTLDLETNFEEIKNFILHKKLTKNWLIDDGVKTPEKASKMLEPDDIRPFGAPPSNLKIVDGEVDKLNRNDV